MQKAGERYISQSDFDGLRSYFQTLGGEMPDPTTLRRHTREWRTKAAGGEPISVEQLPPILRIQRLIQEELPVEAHPPRSERCCHRRRPWRTSSLDNWFPD